MIIKSIWNKDSIDHLLALAVLALDAGFSATARSCGIAWSAGDDTGSDTLTHQAAIDKLIAWMHTHSESVLIIEAPLSTAYRDGNPARRGDFEKEKLDGKNTKTRDWYSGPGAAVTLAALNILRKLQLEGSLAETTVHLLEGFVSFGDARSHQQVAEALRNSFRNNWGTWHQVTNGLETLTVTTLAGIKGATEPPAILIPPPL
ncbi:MAG: hypothetical protein NTW21_27550 [Verrucomicrobia bacterium]|nr:hypothetical protein [Verrucomicrobiota bacterium]